MTPTQPPSPIIIQKAFLSAILLALILVILGWILVPTTNYLSLASACLILTIYALTGFVAFPRISPKILITAGKFGLLAGAIFAAEILLEYAILPKNNSTWGLIEFSAVFALYFFSATLVSYRHKTIKSGTQAAVISALLSSVIWLIFILLTFYIFRGTLRQQLVFTAEGNYQDFARSGMSDFNAFIMEDFFGAGFFHLLLSPIFAFILGTLGSLFGKRVSPP